MPEREPQFEPEAIQEEISIIEVADKKDEINSEKERQRQELYIMGLSLNTEIDLVQYEI